MSSQPKIVIHNHFQTRDGREMYSASSPKEAPPRKWKPAKSMTTAELKDALKRDDLTASREKELEAELGRRTW